MRPLLLLAALALPLAACGGADDPSEEAIEETGQPGVLGRMGELQAAAERMQEEANRAPAEPVNFRTLRELLPDEAAGLAQGETEGSTDGAMGFSISRVEATYGEGDPRIDISVMDYGAIPSMAMMGLGWTMADLDRESGSSYERTVTLGERRGYRTYDSEARSGEFSLLVGDRFHVEVTGTGVSDDDLEAALRAVDLAGLEALRDEGRPDA